jgi:hypothetical protein
MTAADESQSLLDGLPPNPKGRESWRVEITGMGGDPSDRVQVTLVDAETGKRLGAQVVPFEWIRDVAHGSTAVVPIRRGVWA